jgi:hypothetical protein
MTFLTPMPTDPPPFGEPPPADLIPADDPYLQTLVARVLAPHAHGVTPEVYEAMRAQLIVTLTTHPSCAPLIERARRAPRVERSGTRDKPGSMAPVPVKKERAG